MKRVAETQKITGSLRKMEARLAACVDTRVDIAIISACEKVDKSYAEVMAVQSKEAKKPILAHQSKQYLI